MLDLDAFIQPTDKVTMQWLKPKGEKSLPEATWQPKDLLPRLKKLPAKRMLAVPNITSDALDFRLFFDDSATALPPGFSSPELATFTVSGGLRWLTCLFGKLRSRQHLIQDVRLRSSLMSRASVILSGGLRSLSYLACMLSLRSLRPQNLLEGLNLSRHFLCVGSLYQGTDVLAW